MERSLYIILFGEPRGLGNSLDCPGSNQIDKILELEELSSRFERIHIRWSLVLDKVSYQPWDNDYMIDKYGERWNSHEYMDKDSVVQSIRNYMRPYADRITFDVYFREPNLLRWGKDYHNEIKLALDSNYSHIMWHRPDLNLKLEKYKDYDKKFDAFLQENEKPVVAVTRAPHFLLRTFEEGIDQVPHSGVFMLWNNYEITLWNRAALEIAEKLIFIKAENQEYYTPPDPFDPLTEESPFAQFMYAHDGAETFWGIMILAMSALTHRFTALDVLPIRSLIREAPHDT